MSTTNEQESQEDKAIEAAFRRGVHQGVFQSYDLLCKAHREGSSIDDIIDKVCKLENRISEWRRSSTFSTPPW